MSTDAVLAKFIYCGDFDEADVAANRRGVLTASQQRGPVLLVVLGAIIGAVVTGGGLLYAWSSRESDVACGRFTGCTEAGAGTSDLTSFLVIAVPSVLLGLGVLGLCIWDYRRQCAVAAQATASTIRVTVRDDLTDPEQPSKALVVPAGQISLVPSVAERFETGAVYDVHYSGAVVLSFERPAP